VLFCIFKIFGEKLYCGNAVITSGNERENAKRFYVVRAMFAGRDDGIAFNL